MNIVHKAYLILFTILVCVASLLWVFRYQMPEGRLPKESITLIAPDGLVESIVVEVADDPLEQSKGLMFRDKLSKGEGMLFIFTEEQQLNFWMKNTRIPLDILYFNAQKKFISRASMNPCLKDPCTSYPSEGQVSYALEVNHQEPKTQRVSIGWKMDR